MKINSLFFAALALTTPFFGYAVNPKPPVGPPLSKEALRRCVAIDNQLSNHTKQYNVEVKLHNAVVAKRQEMRKVLDVMQVALDAGDNSKIAEYNIKVDEYNLEASKLEPHQTQMTQIAVERNQASAEYNTKCANRAFRHEDMAEINRANK